MRVFSVPKINFESLKINTLYFNDCHSSTEYLDAFSCACDVFEKESLNADMSLILSGGDIFLDEAQSNQKVAKIISSKLDAAAVGNHDIGNGERFSWLIKNFNMFSKWLGINLKYAKETDLSNLIKSSVVIKKNGEKIGVIGVAPFDFKEQTHVTPKNDYISVDGFNETIENVRCEVKKLEEAGIDKIFLLSHTGENTKENIDYYSEFAKIGGIDVIIGGHDHREVDKWFVSTRGEPVKVVSVGNNGENYFEGKLDYFGKLNLFFDDFGVLVKDKCLNVFERTDKYANEKQDEINAADICYILKSSVICKSPLTSENKVANIVADADLWYANKYSNTTKAKFAFVNAAAIRGNFRRKEILFDDIKNIVPFQSKLIKTSLTKRQIIESLNWGVKSLKFSKITPGIMQVSGLNYSIDKNGNVYDVKILNSDGSVDFNLDEVDENYEIPCVYDEFLLTGAEGLIWLKKDLNSDKVEKLNIPREEALKKYLIENNQINDYIKERIKNP